VSLVPHLSLGAKSHTYFGLHFWLGPCGLRRLPRTLVLARSPISGSAVPLNCLEISFRLESEHHYSCGCLAHAVNKADCLLGGNQPHPSSDLLDSPNIVSSETPSCFISRSFEMSASSRRLLGHPMPFVVTRYTIHGIFLSPDSQVAHAALSWRLKVIKFLKTKGTI